MAGRLLGSRFDLLKCEGVLQKDDHMFVRCNPYLNLWVQDELDPKILEEHPSDPSPYVTTRPRCEMASIDEVYLDLTEEAG